MADRASELVEALRAAGEPTRLRILSLLREGDLAVGELVHILDQSQPRLSHHLKTLTAAGLVERLPEGSWVFYRLATSGWQADLLAHLFTVVETDEQTFTADHDRLDAVRTERASSAASYFSDIADDWDRLRALHSANEAIEAALLDLAGSGPFRKLVDLGTGTGRMMVLFADHADAIEGLDLSHRMLTVARANLDRAGVRHASVRQGDVSATPFDTASADIVILHQVLHYLDRPEQAIAEAARLLQPGGILLVVDFAPHELEFLRQDHGHRRLGIRNEDLRSWASASGLDFSAPRRFAPPDGLDEGLHVNIWRISRPAGEQEIAA